MVEHLLFLDTDTNVDDDQSEDDRGSVDRCCKSNLLPEQQLSTL
jgi:hypothetical protein